jgi:uncharacterized protein YgbK (DUF1537 family)
MTTTSSLEQVLGDVPPPLAVPGAREVVRRTRSAEDRRTAVLDDDPTGSQSVHGVSVVTVLDPGEYARALAEPGSTCFVLTNTRSLPESDAAATAREVGRDLLRAPRGDREPDLVSRSDSTLRGHVWAEVAALQAAREDVLGERYDGVLLVPAFLEAGRITAGDVHWARVDGRFRPVGETEFARDASFGYASSDLRAFLSERAAAAGTRLDPADVLSIGLEDIRRHGPERVATLLTTLDGGRFGLVNATDYADLEVVALAVLEAQAGGRRLLHRTGPSFVRALAGIEPRPPLTSAEIWSGPRESGPAGHGLVVVGSHVGLTSRQLAAARAAGGLTEVELDVERVIGAGGDRHVAAVGRQLLAALEHTDALLYTSRNLRRGDDAGSSLRIARDTSAAVVEVVRTALPAHPGWVVAKGGITSHDVAVHGLGIRRAQVLGQLLPGQVSVFEPVDAPPQVLGTPYVVFAGNVGDEQTLAHVIAVLRGTEEACSAGP